MTSKERILKLIDGEAPDQIIYAPNYWQWFEHHRNHQILP